MIALLPVLGGILSGWLAPRRTAIALEVLFALVAVGVLTVSAPRHGGSGSITEVAVFAPVVAVVSALALLLGFRLARRRTRTA